MSRIGSTAAVLRQAGGKLYIIAQAWNPGDFAVLEQVGP